VPEDLVPRAETGVAALVVETSVRRTTYTTAASLLPGKPLVRRDEREISLYPFAPGRTDIPFRLVLSADARPVAAEPPALVVASDGGFSCSWEDAVPATASPWKKRFAFSILFPLRDTLDEGVEVRREYARTGDGPATATVRAILPGGGWTIEIACSGRGGKVESVSPEAPEKPSPLISVWRNVSTAAGRGAAAVTLSPQGNLVSYLPRVRITRTERSPAAGAGPLSGPIGPDARWSLLPRTPAALSGSAAETETIYELDEAVEYRQ